MVFLILCGCKKMEEQDCIYNYSEGDIKAISGPDSLRVDEQQSLVFEVTAPELCVSDIDINLTYFADTTYTAEARVKYSSGLNTNCPCEVKDKHYARVYFSSPVRGNITISAPQTIGPVVDYTVKVY